MKLFKKVRGSQETVPTIQVNVDTVYLRENIINVSDDDFNGWEYDEVQYKKDEYIELISKKMASESSDANEMLLDIDFRLSNIELGV